MYHRICLIDWELPENNDFLLVNQLEIVEGDTKKIPDLVLFVNGMPLVVMELKSTSREEVNIEDAYKQLKNYMNCPYSVSFLLQCISYDYGWC